MVGFWSYQRTIIWDSNSVYAHVRCSNLRQLKLVEMVNHLPSSMRQAILLYTFESMRKDIIAAELGESTAQIKKNMLEAGNVMRQFVSWPDIPTSRRLLLNKLFKKWPYQIYAELLNLRINAVIVR